MFHKSERWRVRIPLVKAKQEVKMNCSSIENYVADPNMEKWLREIITVRGKETIPPKEYDEIVKRLCYALSFFGEYGREALRKKEFSVIFASSSSKRTSGAFYTYTNEIEIYNVLQRNKVTIGRSPSSYDKKTIEDVFVHEFAHFIDHQKCQLTHNYYTHISSIRSSKERQIADAYITRMRWKEKPSRSIYKGRTCELFARAIAEYWGIIYGLENSYKRVHTDDYYESIAGTHAYNETWDEYVYYLSDIKLDYYYVERDLFLEHIAPLVADYMKGIQEGTLS